MFRFENIDLLWALLLVPFFVLIFILLVHWKKRAIRTFGDNFLMLRLMPEVSTGKPLVKFIFFCIAFVFLIFGLANPQIGTKFEEVKREGVDIIISLDVSNSMLAEDLSPNRIERAKRAIEQLVDKLHNDRIGIIVFGGQAYTQLPITTDYAAAKLFLSTIRTDLIPTQGTAIGAAISQAMESFDFNNKSGKAIVIISDGEDHEGDVMEEIKAATEKQVVIHTIGMGSAQGAPIPLYKQGHQIGFKKDKEGNTVVTKINEEMLAQIASAGSGIYVRASNAESGLTIVLDKINKMQKAEYGTKIYTDYEDRFQYCIAISLFFLLLEFIISDRKSKWISSLKLSPFIFFPAVLSLIISLLFSFQVFSQVEKKYIRNGNKNYAAGKYEDAEKNYQEALEKNSSSVYGKFNKADALYRQEKYDEAAQQFGNITSITDDKMLKSKAFHNLGNSLLRSQKIGESVDAYKNALRNNPGDEDSRKNLAYAMRLLQQQQQQQNDKNDKNQDKKEEQQEQQDQQQQDQKEQQQQEQKKDQLSKQDAQRLLESMNNDEKKLQEKLKKEKLLKAQPIQIEKDW